MSSETKPAETWTSQDVMDQACAMMSVQTGLKIEVSREDRLACACIEAAQWLRQGAPHRALATLESAIDWRPQ